MASAMATPTDTTEARNASTDQMSASTSSTLHPSTPEMDMISPAEASSSSSTKPNRRVLPPGCSLGPPVPPHLAAPPGAPKNAVPPPHLETKNTDPSSGITPDTRVIWVDFPPGDRQDPFHFGTGRKLAIVAVAVFFTGITAFSASAYSIGMESMCQDLGCTTLQAQVGLGLFAWGFGLAPLVLAPLSEEFGRRWTYIVAVLIYTIFHVGLAEAQNTATVLVMRFLMGMAGSIGATLVGGTISDIYKPQDRGLPMSIFAFCALAGTGIAPIGMSYVEAAQHLRWRWIQWIQMIAMAAYIPFVYFVLPETRAPVLLRRRAKKYRKTRGLEDGGRYTARSEIDKVGFVQALQTSAIRPLAFLFTEPVVLFFAIWISIGWGVLYAEIAGIDFIFSKTYGFDITQVGLVYVTLAIGASIAFGLSFVQDAIYRRRLPKIGVEARLYMPMAAGIAMPIGCFIYAFTSTPSVHWIVPCIGQVILFTGILLIYIACFSYLAECYGSYASSAIAAQSFLRNMIGGAFSMFTHQMYENLTPRWAIFLFGCIASVLAAVPFVAFWYGPQIRARSRYSKLLMAEEKERVHRAHHDAELAAQAEKDTVA